MFGIGVPEMIMIAVIALLVVGPKRLPDLAKSVGKGLAEFRKATDGATETLKEALQVDGLKQEMDDIKETFLNGTSTDTAKQSASPAEDEKKDTSPPHASPQEPPLPEETGRKS